VLGLLVGVLMTMYPSVHAADAVAPVKKASAPKTDTKTDKAALPITSNQHKSSTTEEAVMGKIGPVPTPPGPKEGGEQQERAKKLGKTPKAVKKTETPAKAAPAETPAMK
jgi:hypothetical protein